MPEIEVLREKLIENKALNEGEALPSGTVLFHRVYGVVQTIEGYTPEMDEVTTVPYLPMRNALDKPPKERTFSTRFNTGFLKKVVLPPGSSNKT